MGKKKKATTTGPLLYLTTGAVVLLGIDYFKTRKMANENDRNTNISSYNSRTMNANVEELFAQLNRLEEWVKEAKTEIEYVKEHAADVDGVNEFRNNQESISEELQQAYKDLANSVSLIRKNYISQEDYEDLSTCIGKLTDRLSEIEKNLPQ